MQVSQSYAVDISAIYFRALKLDGWTVGFTERTDEWGHCEAANKMIVFSRPLLVANDEVAFRATLIHELAHALTADEIDDHGPQWQATITRMGGDPSATDERWTRPVYV